MSIKLNMTSGLKRLFLLALNAAILSTASINVFATEMDDQSSTLVESVTAKVTKTASLDDDPQIRQFTNNDSIQNTSGRSSHELYNGFYPLIEDTGYVASRNTWQLGFNQVGFTVFKKISISAQPMLYVANTPNIMLKGQIYSDGKHALAISSSINAMRPNTDNFFSSFYSSRVYVPNSILYVVPIALAHSYKINRHITFHQTATDINVLSREDFKNKANIAYSAVLQLKARQEHSLNLHASEVGFFDHDYYYYGISYRYTAKHFFTQMGYFNRVQLEGVQGIPLFDIGFIL